MLFGGADVEDGWTFEVCWGGLRGVAGFSTCAIRGPEGLVMCCGGGVEGGDCKGLEGAAVRDGHLEGLVTRRDTTRHDTTRHVIDMSPSGCRFRDGPPVQKAMVGEQRSRWNAEVPDWTRDIWIPGGRRSEARER